MLITPAKMGLVKGSGMSSAAAVDEEDPKTGRQVEAEEAGKADMRLPLRPAYCVASPAI